MKLDRSTIESLKNKAEVDPDFHLAKEGLESDPDFPIILLTPDELIGLGTICGFSGNTCFTQELVSFMKANGATKIFANFHSGYGHRDDTIGSANVDVPQKVGNKISRLIGNNGGSWRPNVGEKRGWTYFESE